MYDIFSEFWMCVELLEIRNKNFLLHVYSDSKHVKRQTQTLDQRTTPELAAKNISSVGLHNMISTFVRFLVLVILGSVITV